MRCRSITLVAACLLALAALEAVAKAGEPRFSSTVLARGLENPWEIAWGPDRFLWVTEKSAGRVTRVRPSNGSRRTVLTVRDTLAVEKSQDGLLGMAVDGRRIPGTRSRHLYVSSTYDSHPSPDRINRRQKITRYTYDPRTRRAGRPLVLIKGMPASNDHNSGRLVLGPDRKLYYTIGDQGANQYVNTCALIRSQELPTPAEVRRRRWWRTYQGKILRLNLDGSIPDDNPVIRGVRSHVYSYGHRNPQGIAFGPDGTLYSVEHGPKSDDEVNVIRAGRNYGWPYVNGYRDDKNYVYANWSRSRGVPCADLTYGDYEIPASVPRRKETDWRPVDFAPPIRTLFTKPAGYDFRDPLCPEDEGFVCWPTIGPSSVAVYTARGVPGWRSSLLVTSLKYGRLYRLRLTANGRDTRAAPVETWASYNRYRDIAMAPGGRTFYVSTDTGGHSRGRDGRPATTVDDPGVIFRFSYRGR